MRRLALATALVLATAQARDPHLPAPTFDRTPPTLPASLTSGGVLIFSKTNGWRHIEHLPHSGQVIANIAAASGRLSYRTENAAVFNAAQLARFSVVVLNSSSGDLFTAEQRSAFEAYIRGGGGVVALHAAGGDPSYAWRLYVERIIGAQFIGHPGEEDHFQRATIRVVAPRHPVMAGIADPWTLRDEWYSFAAPPPADSTILANLDEATYRPANGQAMGALHPIIWARTLGRGRVVYAGPGHLPEVYDDQRFRRLIGNAIAWAGRGTARP